MPNMPQRSQKRNPPQPLIAAKIRGDIREPMRMKPAFLPVETPGRRRNDRNLLPNSILTQPKIASERRSAALWRQVFPLLPKSELLNSAITTFMIPKKGTVIYALPIYGFSVLLSCRNPDHRYLRHLPRPIQRQTNPRRRLVCHRGCCPVRSKEA